MKSTKAYLALAFVIAFAPLILIPVWAAYGVLIPEDHGGHGGTMADVKAFRQKTVDYIQRHRLPDGSVRAVPGEPVPILAQQFSYTPNTLRLQTGKKYHLQILSLDVVHGFSLVMDGSSFNTVAMPKMVTDLELRPTRPGVFLTLCTEYCGMAHEFMRAKFIIEGPPVAPAELHEDHEEPHKNGVPHEDDEHSQKH